MHNNLWEPHCLCLHQRGFNVAQLSTKTTIQKLIGLLYAI
jgi:hypothetical protein